MACVTPLDQPRIAGKVRETLAQVDRLVFVRPAPDMTVKMVVPTLGSLGCRWVDVIMGFQVRNLCACPVMAAAMQFAVEVFAQQLGKGVARSCAGRRRA